MPIVAERSDNQKYIFLWKLWFQALFLTGRWYDVTMSHMSSLRLTCRFLISTTMAASLISCGDVITGSGPNRKLLIDFGVLGPAGLSSEVCFSGSLTGLASLGNYRPLLYIHKTNLTTHNKTNFLILKLGRCRNARLEVRTVMHSREVDLFY